MFQRGAAEWQKVRINFETFLIFVVLFFFETFLPPNRWHAPALLGVASPARQPEISAVATQLSVAASVNTSADPLQNEFWNSVK